MKQFGISLFPVGISAGLMTMLVLLMIMPSSTDGIKITVKAEFTVEVDGTDKVEDLKNKIMNEFRIEPIKQTLRLKKPDGTETLLMDTETMTHYGIEEGGSILLSKKFEITVAAYNPIFKVLSTKTNKTTIEVKGIDTVEDLKKKIMEKLNKQINLRKISLQYREHNEFLNDRKTIDHYRIIKGDIVHMTIGEFHIAVQHKIENEVKNYFVWVKSEETVAILKKKIKNESGIEPEDQMLKCCDTNGDGIVSVLEDEKTMANYGIGEGVTTVLLDTAFEILVKYKKGKTFTVWMNGTTDSVKQLKKKIMDKIENVFPGIYIIIINDHPSSDYNEELNNDVAKTLKECGIGGRTTIYLVECYVHDSIGMTHFVELM